jgi:hypothetical protein
MHHKKTNKSGANPAGIYSAQQGFTLIHMAIVLMIVALLVSSAIMGEELVGAYRVHSQISQLATWDEAVRTFYDKFEGLPGDLLAIKAEREGLVTGDGTPGHGDNDGKISPCNLGWQWHLGCETALFWSQLADSGLIKDSYNADSRFTNGRLTHVGSLDPYLPQSSFGEGIYVTVWNTDKSQPSPGKQLPYGNYYEISRLRGVEEEKFIDDSKALTPAQSYAFDSKIDDGLPFSGRVVVNGDADWPKDAWGSFAKPDISNCVYIDNAYNITYLLRARAPLCHLAVRIDCCKKADAK